MKERKSKAGELLGPKQIDEFMAWRRNRDKMIASPRRAKHVTEAEKKKGAAQP